MWEFVTSAEFWKAIATGLGGAATATLILVWLAKTWVGERIKRDVEDTYKAKEQQRQAEFNQALEERKSELSKELEGWKAGYQKVLDENRVRFAKLHEDRVAAIKELFSRLVLAEEAVGAFVNPVRGIHDDEQKLQDEARTAYHEFSVYFTNNRILFTEANCLLIEQIRNKAKDAYSDFTAYGSIPDARDIEARKQWRASRKAAYESMTGEFQKLRKQLEGEFRAAMGMVEEAEGKDQK